MVPEDQVRVITALTLSVPLGYLLRYIRGTFQREIYSFVFGTLLQFYVFGSDIYQIFILHTLVYVMCSMMPKKCGPITTVIMMLILSAYHIYQMVMNYGSWVVDVKTLVMTNICKYSMFAYAIQDGTVKDQSILSEEQKSNRISKMPHFISFFAFCQFGPTAIIGTAIQYSKYKKFITQTDQFKDIPSPWKQIGKDISYALVLAAIHVVGGKIYFPLDTMKDPAFSQNSFFYLLYFSYFGVTFLRFKYYFAWKYSMGAVHASGISYQKTIIKDKYVQNFKGVQTCNPLIVQGSIHLNERIANWNMTAQLWLRKCIYERSFLKSKGSRQLFTFMVSSFWHGFYGGYYFSFFFWFLQLYLQTIIFKNSKKETIYVKIYKKTGIVGKVVLWIGANVLMTVNGVYFQILSLRLGINILISLYFAPVLIIFGLITLFAVYPGGYKIKKITIKKVVKEVQPTPIEIVTSPLIHNNTSISQQSQLPKIYSKID